MKQDTLQSITKIDQKAFKAIFDEYYKPLCAFGYRYVKDSSVAEDMIQEVFGTLWEKRLDFNHEKAIKSFLYTSARNKCLNHLKHKAVLEKHEEKLVYELESESFFTQHVIEEETFNQLYLEIEQLPNAAKKIILLALKGLKNKEIADALNISENTVKTQKKIAYSKLKKGLSPIVNGILLSL